MKTTLDFAALACARAVMSRARWTRSRGLSRTVRRADFALRVSPLATHCRWFSKLIGVDTEFRFGGRTSDPMKEFADQPSAGTLEVYCEAANDAGPGVESATSSINLA